jgi:3'-phosphoadenosine 5'-phosphosulfate sulfotransferase (PAPS reductase)/FAD synthetase
MVKILQMLRQIEEELRLKLLIVKAEQIIKQSSLQFGDALTLSLSGGLDSTIIHHITKKANIDIQNVFSNLQVEPRHNRDYARKIQKEYKNIYNAESESYKSIVYRYGFPIGNKNFSDLAQRCGRKLTSKNVIDKHRIITGMTPRLTYTKIFNSNFLPLKFWYLAKHYPIQTYCCRILKKEPSARLMKKFGLIMVIGIMDSDSPARRRAIAENNKKKLSDRKKIYPLEGWTKEDVLLYKNLYLSDDEYSKQYQSRKIGDVTVSGSTNTGCIGCHYGIAQKIECSDKDRNKFEVLGLEYPKAYSATMKMKHKSGITYEEVIKVYNDSKDNMYLQESILLRNKEILEVDRLLALYNIPYNKEFLLSFLI